MSNFWIQLDPQGMPKAVAKFEFYPSHLGFGWENFGKLGELSEAKAAIAERDDRIAELERTQLSGKDLSIIRNALFRQRIRYYDNGWDLDAEDVKAVERKLEEARNILQPSPFAVNNSPPKKRTQIHAPRILGHRYP